jgi:hypothetical protein
MELRRFHAGQTELGSLWGWVATTPSRERPQDKQSAIEMNLLSAWVHKNVLTCHILGSTGLYTSRTRRKSFACVSLRTGR